MKAAFYPVGGRDRASSRYRVHWICEASPNFYVGDIADHRFNWRSCDALVFQRTVEGKYQNLARAARRAKKLIVLDVTDAYSHRHRWKKLWAGVVEMANFAHCITTGNEDDAHMLRAVFDRRVHVIPGAQKGSSHLREHADVAVPTVVWVGRENTMKRTLGSIWPVFARLTQRGVKFRVLIVNDNGSTHGLKLSGNQVAGRKWKLSEVHSVLATCDVGVCPQAKEPDGRYHKDFNKAILCWSCRVPCVTFAHTKDWEGDLYKLLTNHKLRQRQGQKGVSRAKAWLPINIVKKWDAVLEKELKLK